MKNVYDIKAEKNMNYILSTSYSEHEYTYLARKKKILIIIHLHYIDTVKDYLRFVESIPDYMDIIFTVSDKTVKKILQNTDFINRKGNCKVVEKQNRGRDISAILVTCRKDILEYDYICFLHDKKEKKSQDKNDIKGWIQCLWENMIGSRNYIENVVALFLKNPELGLLVPPFPVSEHFAILYTDVWGGNYFLTKELADNMGLDCDLRIEKQPITLGTVFWAKVSALKKLFEMDWQYESFDEEPLKNDGTISHAIERVFAYVAQDAGFNAGWVMTERYAGELLGYMQRILEKAFYRLDTSLGILKISELESFEERLKELLDFVENYKQFYIFGAGKLGRCCFSMLKSKMKAPVAFLVSESGQNCETIEGIPVCALLDRRITRESGIIVAVGDRYKEEVLTLIKKYNPNFHNIYIYKKE